MEKEQEIKTLKLENELLKHKIEQLEQFNKDLSTAFTILREECEDRGIDINGNEGNDE
jgi:hypothetical protein